MSYSYSDTPSCCSTASAQLKLYQAFIFSIPIFFTFILLFMFYLFYLRRRRLVVVSSSSLQIRPAAAAAAAYQPNPRLSESGLKKELREMLPIIVFSESFSVTDTLCSVCLGDYQAEDRLQQIPVCSHTFHMDCIDHWLATHTTCPLCRLSLAPAAKPDSELTYQQENQAIQTHNVVILEGRTMENEQSLQSSENTRVPESSSFHISNEESCDIRRAEGHSEQTGVYPSVIFDIEAQQSDVQMGTGVLP